MPTEFESTCKFIPSEIYECLSEGGIYIYIYIYERLSEGGIYIYIYMNSSLRAAYIYIYIYMNASLRAAYIYIRLSRYPKVRFEVLFLINLFSLKLIPFLRPYHMYNLKSQIMQNIHYDVPT